MADGFNETRCAGGRDSCMSEGGRRSQNRWEWGRAALRGGLSVEQGVLCVGFGLFHWRVVGVRAFRGWALSVLITATFGGGCRFSRAFRSVAVVFFYRRFLDVIN